MLCLEQKRVVKIMLDIVQRTLRNSTLVPIASILEKYLSQKGIKFSYFRHVANYYSILAYRSSFDSYARNVLIEKFIPICGKLLF